MIILCLRVTRYSLSIYPDVFPLLQFLYVSIYYIIRSSSEFHSIDLNNFGILVPGMDFDRCHSLGNPHAFFFFFFTKKNNFRSLHYFLSSFSAISCFHSFPLTFFFILFHLFLRPLSHSPQSHSTASFSLTFLNPFPCL